jgi:hypothetical protein
LIERITSLSFRFEFVKSARPGTRTFQEGQIVDLGISDSRLAGGSPPANGGVFGIVFLLAMIRRL